MLTDKYVVRSLISYHMAKYCVKNAQLKYLDLYIYVIGSMTVKHGLYWRKSSAFFLISS